MLYKQNILDDSESKRKPRPVKHIGQGMPSRDIWIEYEARKAALPEMSHDQYDKAVKEIIEDLNL